MKSIGIARVTQLLWVCLLASCGNPVVQSDPNYPVSGIVFDRNDSSSITNAEISLTGSDGSKEVAATDKYGAFHFELYSRLKYNIEVYKKGFLMEKIWILECQFNCELDTIRMYLEEQDQLH